MTTIKIAAEAAARELLSEELRKMSERITALRTDRDTLAEFLAAVPQDALRGTLKAIVGSSSSQRISELRQRVEDASPVYIFTDGDGDGDAE